MALTGRALSQMKWRQHELTFLILSVQLMKVSCHHDSSDTYAIKLYTDILSEVKKLVQ